MRLRPIRRQCRFRSLSCFAVNMSIDEIIEEVRKAQGLMRFGYWDAADDLLEDVMKSLEELKEQMK